MKYSGVVVAIKRLVHWHSHRDVLRNGRHRGQTSDEPAVADLSLVQIVWRDVVHDELRVLNDLARPLPVDLLFADFLAAARQALFVCRKGVILEMLPGAQAFALQRAEVLIKIGLERHYSSPFTFKLDGIRLQKIVSSRIVNQNLYVCCVIKLTLLDGYMMFSEVFVS